MITTVLPMKVFSFGWIAWTRVEALVGRAYYTAMIEGLLGAPLCTRRLGPRTRRHISITTLYLHSSLLTSVLVKSWNTTVGGGASSNGKFCSQLLIFCFGGNELPTAADMVFKERWQSYDRLSGIHVSVLRRNPERLGDYSWLIRCFPPCQPMQCVV
ncbi:uncharacterized protein LOC120656348 isoform X2 [Panicum virgatum]|uniref:uncharacterized protein LOC120656348 isoform X2 n=1 Tax=Panicum virgatum TaxID=38727 RepID=UPI0019D636E2|nr:uncharacterized protein LOC120656348 isoform X2 [Panicum virgatum]